MRKMITSVLMFSSVIFITSCSKPSNNPTAGTSTTHPNVTLTELYNTWVKDDEGDPGTWIPSVHFYAGRTDVSIEIKDDHTYVFKYTLTSNSSVVTENGSWTYDASTYKLNMTPQSGSPYFYRVVGLNEEQLTLGYNYPTYDNEGVQNGTAEEIVHLEDND